jgi:hypothetical protein
VSASAAADRVCRLVMRNLEDADISNYLRHNAEGNEMGTV